MFWERGTSVATAITPVIVALVSEALKRPVEGHQRGRAARGATHRHGRRGAQPQRPRFERPAPARRSRIEVDPRAAPDDPFGLRRARARAAASRRRSGELALVTGLLAFVDRARPSSPRPSWRSSATRSSRAARARRFFGGSSSSTPTPTATPTATPGRRQERDADAATPDARRATADAERDAATADADAAPPRRPRRADAAAPGRDADARAATRRLGAWPRTGSRPRASRARRGSSGLAAGQAARQLGTRATNLARAEEGKQAALERRHLEAAEQIVAALGTMKGAAMKLGQVMSLPRRRARARGVPRGVPAQARRAARRGAEGALRRHAQGDRVRARRAARARRSPSSTRTPIAAASIGQVYRARAARRARRRGQGPVPGRRPGGAGRHAEPGDDPAADEADRAGARRQGDRRGDPRAHRRRARLRARGAEPALAGAHLPRPPVHRRARRRDLAVAREGDRHRVRLRRSASTRSSSSTRRRATASARSSSASTSAACTATTSSPATRTPATSC